jgi:hypothetical protein
VKRVHVWVLAGLLVCASQAAGQDWARKMFEITNHEFGTVGRGTKQEFAFAFTNNYKEDVHVASVRSSCGCTTPHVTKDLLKTHEKAEIVTVYNTKSFLGAKSATITVVFDQPYYAEVQLTVTGYIRSDVVFSPGSVDFGEVSPGNEAQVAVEVAYAGRDDWQIVDVRSANRNFEVELDETERSSGRVNYKMVVHLKTSAPPGYLQDQLTIVTNDANSKTISLPVEGQVTSPLSVSPSSLFLGILTPGQTVKKNLVVRGAKPFKITGLQCADARFTLPSPAAESKTLHFIPVEFTAGTEDAKIAEKIVIQTDLNGGLTAECLATATVKP